MAHRKQCMNVQLDHPDVIVKQGERGLRQGHNVAFAHHGEIVQGVFETQDGRLWRGLVTLPCNLFHSTATFLPNKNGSILVKPSWKSKAWRAVELTFTHCGIEHWGGELVLQSNIPLCWGLGSSTCDITAAIRAVMDAFEIQLAPIDIAKLAVLTECATDSIMFEDRTILFAYRDGTIIEDFNSPLPSLEVIGFNTDSTGFGVDTLNLPPACYSWWEIEAFRPILGLLRRALHNQDVRLIGQAASASARINQRHLPKPHFDRLEKLVETVGAAGLQIAHSGTIAGIIFDANDTHKHEKMLETQHLLAEMKFDSIWHFQTPNP